LFFLPVLTEEHSKLACVERNDHAGKGTNVEAHEMNTGQPSLRARKYADARRALFEAAMELFCDQGFDETSVDAIAERAGFSRATFFNHFGSKAAVLRFYGEQLLERVGQILGEADCRTAPLDSVQQILLAMAKDAEAHREDLKVLFAYSMRDPGYMAHPTPARERSLRVLAKLISEAQRRRQARNDITAQEQAAQLLGLYNNAVVTIVFSRRDAKTTIDGMWKFALGGIRGRNTLAQ
jgi:AcrR family transcriptional regulator